MIQVGKEGFEPINGKSRRFYRPLFLPGNLLPELTHQESNLILLPQPEGVQPYTLDQYALFFIGPNLELSKNRREEHSLVFESRREDLNLHNPVYKTGAMPFCYGGKSSLRERLGLKFTTISNVCLFTANSF